MRKKCKYVLKQQGSNRVLEVINMTTMISLHHGTVRVATLNISLHHEATSGNFGHLTASRSHGARARGKTGSARRAGRAVTATRPGLRTRSDGAFSVQSALHSALEFPKEFPFSVKIKRGFESPSTPPLILTLNGNFPRNSNAECNAECTLNAR